MKIGVDIVYIPRVKEMMKVYGEKFVKRVLTQNEVRNVSYPPYIYVAGRIAGKEAVFKTISPSLSYIRWKEIEIISKGPPVVSLSGFTRSFAESIKVKRINLSISHDGEYAIAFAIAEV